MLASFISYTDHPLIDQLREHLKIVRMQDLHDVWLLLTVRVECMCLGSWNDRRWERTNWVSVFKLT